MAAAVLTPVAAQNASRIPDPAVEPRDVEKDEESTEARRVMNEYGACIVKIARPSAEAAVSQFPGTRKAAESLINLATSECLMYGELRFQPALFRGSLFQALYEADFESGPADISAAAPLDYFAGAADPADGDVRQQVALRQFADCVTRAKPQATRALILSEVGRPAEQAAFSSLMPALSQCLPQGVELSFSRVVLRGLLAETMYRLSRAATASATMGSR